VSESQLKDTNRNDDVFRLDELVKTFTQSWLHIASEAPKSKSMAFGGILGSRCVVPSLGRTKRYGAVHFWRAVSFLGDFCQDWRMAGAGDG
jgi:hypothetical protein